MSTLLAELSYKDIFTVNDAYILRNYISSKKPFLSNESNSRVFADAVIRIVDRRLPKLEDEQRSHLMEVLFRDAICKPSFTINCSDVFKAAVVSGSMGNWFFREMVEWVGDILGKPVRRENIFSLVIQTRKMMSENPGMAVEQIMEAIEKDIAIFESSNINTAISQTEVIMEYSDRKTEKSLTVDIGTSVEVGTKEAIAENSNDAKHIENDFEASVYYEKIQEKFIPNTVAEMPDYAVADITVSSRALKRSLRERLGSLFYTGASSKIAAGRSIIFAGFAGLIISSLLPMESGWLTARENHSEVNLNVTQYSSQQYIGNNDLANFYRLNRNGLVFYGNQPDTANIRKMRATAYDLSVASCGKLPDEPGYGITCSGTKATAGRTVAVDPDVIPLGSKLYISFPDKYKHMNGIYYAEDTGRLIKGDKVDIFFGEDKKGSYTVNNKAMEFGVQYVEIRIIE